MVESEGVPEQVRRVLDDVLRDLRLDRAHRATLWRDVAVRIGQACRERLDASWWESLFVGYAFDMGSADDRRRGAGVQFGAFDGFVVVPVALRQEHPRSTVPRDVADEIAAKWAMVGRDSSLHPALQARMADLTWAREDRFGGIHWFELAVDAYVRLSERDNWHILDRCMGVRRAITIAAETHRVDLMDRCESAAALMIRASLARGDGEFGIVFPLLAALVSHERDIDQLLDDALVVYRASPEHRCGLLELVALASPDQSADVARRQVEAFEQHAACHSGLRALHWLRRALAVARHHNDDLAISRLLVKVQECDLDEDMQSFTIDHEIDKVDVDAFAAQFATGDGLASDLAAWSLHCPLQDEADALEDARSQIAAFPLQHLFGQVLLADDDTVRDVAPGSDEQVEVVMHRNDMLGLQLFGGILGREALRRICDDNDDELDHVEALFACPWIDPDAARRIARALRKWHDNELDRDDLRLLTLCVEPTVRTMMRLCRLPVTRLARTGKGAATEPMPLGAMLSGWDGLPELRRRYFTAVLTNPQTMPIRNLVGHGVDADIHPETPFILIFHIMCCLRFHTLEVTPHQAADA